MIFLELEDLLHIANRSLGAPPEIRDLGLLESALARPLTTVFGDDAYPGLFEKAAALLHSLARNHALVDGNKRVAMDATLAFLALNGYEITLQDDGLYDLVIRVATGRLDDVPELGALLERSTEPRG